MATLIMLMAVVYQRKTGPTHPLKGTLNLAGHSAKYKLLRSDWSIKTIKSTRISLPTLSDMFQATIYYKRFRTNDAFTALPMKPETTDRGKKEVAAYLPAQPAAGKLEYYIEVRSGNETQQIPEKGQPHVVMRFKDHVPLYILIPHIFMMFFSVLIGMRAGLGAIWAPRTMRRWAWLAFAGMSLGGMVLGPIVQKFAFGEYWTGFPWGSDWTDNKMLMMWGAWLIGLAVAGLKARKKDMICRVAIVLASIVMTGAYLIPHSMGGSELNYSQVDQGIDPSKAISTGRK